MFFATTLALLVDIAPWPGGKHGFRELDDLFHGRIDVWPALLYLGLASSCAVYVLQFYLIRRVGAVQQMAVDYLTPIVGVVEGAAFRCNLCDASPPQLGLVAASVVLAFSGVAAVSLEARAVASEGMHPLIQAGSVAEADSLSSRLVAGDPSELAQTPVTTRVE